MMLYARLVIESLSYLANLQDIREELKMLPDGLDEASVFSQVIHELLLTKPLQVWSNNETD
jgi:hypothetical protein